MSRKDIIIISVLINAGLLAVLFVTALKTDSESVNEGIKPQETQATRAGSSSKGNEIVLNVPQRDYGISSSQDSSPDEVDMVLKEYLPEMVESAPITKTPPRMTEDPREVKEETVSLQTVDVVVKSGDALEKIARANRTTVDAIRKANNLSSDKLKIGQVLKVPVGTVKAPPPQKEVKNTPSRPAELADSPVYYVIKPGDNPWKIAKLHDVKFDDLLILNNLDEERAKNLKVGEKIRVR